MVQFIHAADLHLDSPFKGIKNLPPFIWEAIYQSTFQALTNLVDLAITEKVDFVCLAGDIYDGEDRSVKAQAYLKNELNRLNKAGIPVYLIHGNHDYIEQHGLLLDMPENVHIFSPEVETFFYETKNQERVALSGFSYDKRWITEKRVSDYPMRHANCDYHIGLLHGYQEGNAAEHDRYAPFHLQELKSKHYDYWALGHIHKRQVLSEQPLIVYPGNTQGRNRTEEGPKGCSIVTLGKGLEKSEFYPLAPIEWKTAELSLAEKKSLQEVYQLIHETVSALEQEGRSTLLTLELTNTDELLTGVKRKIAQGDLLEGLQQITPAIPFVWLIQMRMKTKEEKLLPSLIQLFPEEWDEAIAELQQEEPFSELTQSFFDNQRMNSSLHKRDETYRKKIVQMASQEIRQELGHEGSVLDEN